MLPEETDHVFKVFCADCKAAYDQTSKDKPTVCGLCGSNFIATKNLNAALIDVIKAVRDFAHYHYEQDGWDTVIECWSDQDIRSHLFLGMTASEAINVIGSIVKRADSVRKDVCTAQSVEVTLN